jgi:hypothetical protein
MVPHVPASASSSGNLLRRLSNQGAVKRLVMETPAWGLAMRYRDEVIPLAIMGSLSAAIMVVFAVTVLH